MINAVNREIPDYVLKSLGRDIFRGTFSSNCKFVEPNNRINKIHRKCSKLVDSIREVLEKCEIKDGMTISFHHHLREGDYIVNMVMKEIHQMGIKNIAICASSLGKAHDPIVPYIEDGTITSIFSSGVRGEIGKAISDGKLSNPAVLYSHGGRVRNIEEGRICIDIAFIAAPTCDILGNMRGIGGKSDCGVLSYAHVDAHYADKVVAITDTLLPFPNVPASISMIHVDYVLIVDAIGDPKKIASGAARETTDQRKLLMAKYCSDFITKTSYFKNGFVYQTGIGGASIATTYYIAEVMRKNNIRMGIGLGGIATPMVKLMKEGLIDTLLDTQAFDLGAVQSIKEYPERHIEISASEYANPLNKGSFVNQLDLVILSAMEVDISFNCNVITDSTGMITGAQGGHPDTAEGAKCTIVITPLIQGRSPTICTEVTTVTTPGEVVDVLVTDYGIAINPRRPDLLIAAKASSIPVYLIEELRDIAYKITGVPQKIKFGDRVVGVVEARDGTIIDVIRQIKEFRFS